jgi:hypothetical protein
MKKLFKKNMTSKNNPLKRLGRLFYNARTYQKLSLADVARDSGISIPKLIALEEARTKFYEEKYEIAIETARAYENFLGVDANVIIQEIEFFSEEASKKGIPKFLLKEIKLD